MKLATLAIFAAVPGLASSKPVGLRLESKSTAATASIMYTSAGGLELSASKCVDRSSFCGRYKRTDCPQSKAAVASSIKLANANNAAMYIHLLQDGTLTFDVGTNGCVNPIASWSDEPTHGALLQDGASRAFVATSGTGLDLMSSNGFSVQGGAIEPGCTCTNGIAHTDSCMAHEDHHCASCEAGFWLDGKTCAPFTVCKAGEHEVTAPVQTTSNRVCTENDSGTFTSAAGQVTAVTWRTCGTGEGMVSEGTATKDRECGKCELGKSFSNSNDGEPCTEVNVCNDGEYESEAPTLTSDRTCATHAAECSSHEYEAQAPSGTQDRQCKANVCHCPNGSHTTSWACPKHGDPMCAYCSGAYHLANGNRQCDANICSCTHGAVATGAACTVHGATKCTSCNLGYHLEGDNCVITPINGGWGAWTSGPCSVTACGKTGTLTRSRTCDNPAPKHGGKGCTGSTKMFGNFPIIMGTENVQAKCSTPACPTPPSCYSGSGARNGRANCLGLNQGGGGINDYCHACDYSKNFECIAYASDACTQAAAKGEKSCVGGWQTSQIDRWNQFGCQFYDEWKGMLNQHHPYMKNCLDNKGKQCAGKRNSHCFGNTGVCCLGCNTYSCSDGRTAYQCEKQQTQEKKCLQCSN